MQKIKILVRKRPVFYGLISLILAVVVPILCTLLHVPKAVRILWLFLVIDTLFCIWVGYDIQRTNQRWWSMLIFPIIFLIFAFFKYNDYVYWLSAFYLGITYLTLGLYQKNKHTTN
ncbi:hypothetical protein ACNAN0_06505 [Agrilactobacillus fermenti]|uniref:hypothetical protein n=1 Tax=Agrilactobacillus fermenti TaxID=2586909 RepID=UPI001E379112|nr:hypothetical protein [Agrilactobacillus fermenti]MCD2255797.1 hypothetical protein [Agrilactobacillus fermenti]